MGRLITSSDRFHVHKSLGVVCLCSFLFSYLWHWPVHGRLYTPWWLMCAHLALSCTSLFFHVPLRRIHRYPTMIWEEYRLHAVVFSFRAFAVAYLPDGALRVAGVALVHVCADLVTSRYGTPGQTTVRGDASRPPKTALVRRLTPMYSIYQFLALGSHLHPSAGPDIGFNAFIGVQSSAFCMTLHRKGFITWRTHAAVYSACIITSAVYIVTHLPSCVVPSLLAFALRSRFGCNKYALWLAVACILRLGPTAPP